jgi:transposase InsO family protein
MNIRLHKNATTTPRTRAYIQQSSQSNAELARELGVDPSTIRRWRERDSVEDRSHAAHRLQTTLSDVQEWLVVELRRSLLLPLDDLLRVTREYINPKVSRSGLDRCLRRHGVGKLAELLPEGPPKSARKPFKDYVPGFVHIDIKYLPQMPDESRRRYLFVAIDRATRWVYLELRSSKSASSAQGFLANLIKQAPFHVRLVLTDNDKAFTDRFCATGERQPTGQHVFDQQCAAHGIEHRLIPPRRPQTNGMVERFNGRIAQLLRRERFFSRRDLAQTLHQYLHLYNQHLPQKALDHRTPIEAMKDWYHDRPELFRIRPVNRPGPDT